MLGEVAPSAELVGTCGRQQQDGNQWQSVAISGNQWKSEAISGNQRQSVTCHEQNNDLSPYGFQRKLQPEASLSGRQQQDGNQWQSVAISGNQWQSVAISGRERAALHGYPLR